MKNPLKFLGLLSVAAMMSACQSQNDATPTTPDETTAKHDQNNTSTQNTEHNPHDLASLLEQIKNEEGSAAIETPPAQPIYTKDGKVRVDWQFIDTKTERINPDDYPYPFDVNSQPVLNYAKAYNITAKQSQHAMTVSMASPEALGKILDQLSDYYLGHEIIDGADVTLVIYTKPKVVGERHEYVFADKFGEGLVLPIEIKPMDKSQMSK